MLVAPRLVFHRHTFDGERILRMNVFAHREEATAME